MTEPGGYRFAARCLGALLALAAASCARSFTLGPFPSPEPEPRGSFQAGVARVDITPPPGLGMAGYGPEGRRSRGYRQRLYARVLVLEDARGERVALVQADLGFASAILHRRTAELTAQAARIGADRLILAATHTHTAPSHTFDGYFYNLLASREMYYEPRLVDFLVQRIAAAVTKAADGLRPAAVAWGSTSVWGETRNRSLEAAGRNPDGGEHSGAPPELERQFRAVAPKWTMLRVDWLDTATGETTPAAAFSVFAIHGTANPSGEDLYDPDIFGYLERAVERHIDLLNGAPQRGAGAPHAVHLVANGASGDVSPNWPPESRCVRADLDAGARRPPEAAIPECLTAARRYQETAGPRLGARAVALYDSLGGSLRGDVLVARAFRTVSPRDESAPGGFCASPRVGTPMLGGAEDGRSQHYGRPFLLSGLVVEGETARHPERSCQREKRTAVGFIQSLFASAGLPGRLQIAVVRIGPGVLAALPVEVTAEAGERIEAAIADTLRAIGEPAGQVAVIGLANGYASYVTTPEEYGAQSFEGAATLSGPNSGPTLAAALKALAAGLGPGAPDASVRGVVPLRVQPGPRGHRMPRLLAGPAPALERAITRAECRGDTLVAEWVDLRPERMFPADSAVLLIQREVSGGAEWVTWDDDPALEIRGLGRARGDGYRWQARWTPRWTPGRYRIVLAARPLRSLAEVAGDWQQACR